MKALLTNWRTYALFIIGCIGLLLLFSEPTDNSNFLFTFLWTKSAAFGLLYLCHKLASYWERTGAIDFSHFTELNDTWE